MSASYQTLTCHKFLQTVSPTQYHVGPVLDDRRKLEISAFLPRAPSTRKFGNSSSLQARFPQTRADGLRCITTQVSEQRPLLLLHSSLQARTVSFIIKSQSHRNGSGDGSKKIGLDEKLLTQLFKTICPISPCCGSLFGGALPAEGIYTPALALLMPRKGFWTEEHRYILELMPKCLC